MFLAANYFIALFAEGEVHWWNYPGFELWKFINLAIFIAAGLYLHRVFGKPISEALRMRKEDIRRQLARAREERDQALEKLSEVEARIAGLQSEVATIREKVKAEAQAERQRIQKETEAEMARLKVSARREIELAGKAAVGDLRRFASEQSIRQAEEFIKREIGPEDEARLLKLAIRDVGGRGN